MAENTVVNPGWKMAICFLRVIRATQQVAILAMFFIVVGALPGFTQSGRVLTLNGISDLIEEGVSPNRIAQLVEERGVGFELDDRAMRRLKQDGANDTVLSAVKRMSARYVAEREQIKRQQEEEAKRKRDEASKQKEEEKRRADEEKRRQAELERKEQEEAKQRAEEARQQEEARRKDEEAKRKAEEASQKPEIGQVSQDDYNEVQRIYLVHRSKVDCLEVKRLVDQLTGFYSNNNLVPENQWKTVIFPTPKKLPTIADLARDRVTKIQAAKKNCFRS